MSSDPDAPAVPANIFDALYTATYCQAAASTLFIYDVFVTSDREMVCFWTPNSKRTGASWFFFANKWISITAYVMVLVSSATFPSEKRLAYSSGYYGMIGVTWHAVVPCSQMQLRQQVHCNWFPGPSYTVTIVSRVPLIVADTFLIYITWTKLSSSGGAIGNIRQSKRLSLSDILLRNGTMYFVYVPQNSPLKTGQSLTLVIRVLLTLNTLHLVLSAYTLADEASRGLSYITIFTGPLTAILISRFLLDLQEANQAVVRVDPDDPLHSSRDPYDTPSFISSLGAFMNPDRQPAPHDSDLEWDVGLRLDGEEEGAAQVSDLQAVVPSSSSA
ncbi:hypothetical protein C8T65DRAFT_698026 [Cerioporus squamosus]|nr:hypothetical protein C8T65DRAFT_698026 [Cerioporus squamosus]